MRPFRKVALYSFAALVCLFNNSFAQAQREPVYTYPLIGDAIKVGKTITVLDTVFFNTMLKPTILRTNAVNNVISLRINEDTRHLMPDSFKVSLKVSAIYTDKNNLVDTIKEKVLTIDYNKNTTYKSRDIFLLQGAYSMQINILDISIEYAPSSVVIPLLILENKIQVDRDYAMNPVVNGSMSCTPNAVKKVDYQGSAVDEYGELKISWTPNGVSEAYDVEWTYIDKSALDNGRYLSAGRLDPQLIFKNNASRITTNEVFCQVPLLYDGQGSLFYRVRGVQQNPDGELLYTAWSSDFINEGGLGRYDFNGHERKLNWQATTTFAEEGKHKSVVQYFDGSLRNRQTVTRDNTTKTTIVSETLYDHQGRPVIQVMPAPTLSKLIGFTPNFNKVDVNSGEYDKNAYDPLQAVSSYCNEGAAAMSKSSGAAQYYSPSNPDKDKAMHQFIPDAKGYAFTETQYTQDNTGRIYRQGGVGKDFQIGSEHETKYYYGTPEQTDLDALFGTEAGDASHYQKNMVRDANGQYSVSYVDMHGRTVATALAGKEPENLVRLNSYRDSIQTESLLSPGNNMVKGTSLELSKSLLVTKAGLHNFQYDLGASSLTLEDCWKKEICYDCLYDLTITISDDCNNQQFGGSPKVISKSNFKLFEIDTVCKMVHPLNIEFSQMLNEGSYNITKTLSISQEGLQYYLDSIYLKKNTCLTYEEVLRQQLNVIRQRITDCDQGTEDMAMLQMYREQMIEDLIPGVGQYADPDKIPVGDDDCTGFSIFRTFDATGKKVWQDPSLLYKDEEGNPDFVEVDGVPTKPNDLDQQTYIDHFKDSWAEALLEKHPEYKYYQQYEKYAASHSWDEDFQKTDTYEQAITKGYLNPLASTFAPASQYLSGSDPLYTVHQSGVFKTEMEKYMQQPFAGVDSRLKGISLWSVATILSKCTEPIDNSCTGFYSQPTNAFNKELLCVGDLDMAWRIFRDMYMDKKQLWLDQYIRSQIGKLSYPCKPLVPVFPIRERVISEEKLVGNAGSEAEGKNIADARLQAMIGENCKAYTKRWLEQLGTCNYTPTQSNIILQELVDVCKEGGDAQHIMGASTVRPVSTHKFRSFDEVIRYYNAQWQIADNNCNAYLIDKPLPNNQPDFLVQKPLWSKPEDCECEKLNTLFNQYSGVAGNYNNFSDYLQKRWNTHISQTALDSLRALCSGTINCKFIPQPIYLPPVLQCNTGEVCIDCSQFKQAYDSFKVRFPSLVPTIAEEDEVQQQTNRVFANYLNQKFGFSYTAADYLNFSTGCDTMKTVPGTNATDSSLLKLVNDFKSYYSLAKNGQVYKNYKISQAASTLLDAVNAILKAKRSDNTFPAGYASAADTRNFDAKLRSVINRNGRYHVIVPLPLQYTIPGDARFNGLRNNTVLETDFITGPVTQEQLTTKYYATVLFDAGQSFQQIWSSKYSGSYSYYGVATPLLKYLPDAPGSSENHIYQLTLSSSASSVVPISNAGVQQVRDLRLDPALFPFGDNFSGRGLRVTLDMVDGTQRDGYVHVNYGSYVQYKEQVDSNLYSSDCRKAFAYYFNKQRGTKYTSNQVDSILRVNMVPLTFCGSEAYCSQVVVLSTGTARPEHISCEQLIATYKNFQADFPHPEKGATVKVYREAGNEMLMSLAEAPVKSIMQEKASPGNFSIAASALANTQETVLPMADSIIAPLPDSIQAFSKSSVQALSKTFALNGISESGTMMLTAVPNRILVDSLLTGKALFEWYFNTNFNTSGYSYEQFMDWLVNGCDYKVRQLPFSDEVEVCCDTLQTILKDFLKKYPQNGGTTITETKVVPVQKINHVFQYYNYYGQQLQEATGSSSGALAAMVWTNGNWFRLRDNVGFNFNVLPQNATINSAALNLYAKPEQVELYPCCGAHYRTGRDSIYGIFERLDGPVMSNQTLWSNLPSTSPAHALTLAPVSGSGTGDVFSNQDYLNQSCTGLVQDLYAKAQENQNYGLLFRLNTENLSYKAYTFWGITAQTPAGKMPYLSVNYTASRCDVFTAFINNALGTHLNIEQIQSLYSGCGIALDVCPKQVYDAGLTLCGKATPMDEIVQLEDDVCADSVQIATVLATERYRLYTDSLNNTFREAYTQKCLNILDLESFTVSHPVSEYHYTLYYYDQAGNLVKTISPEGVYPNRELKWLRDVANKRKLGERKVPEHGLATVYRYNSLNAVVSQNTPDAGVSRFWYDRLGRLVVSQNAQQKLDGTYSYTRYDGLGRITEVGKKPQPAAMTNALARNSNQLAAWLAYTYTGTDGQRLMAEEVTQTVYDLKDLTPLLTQGVAGVVPVNQKAYTLRNRVSYTRYFNRLSVKRVGGTLAFYTPRYEEFESSTTYGYDIHGNVDTLLQTYRTGVMANHSGNRFKTIAYKYDLVSGKVNEVHYQPGLVDALYHRYRYDGDNRLTDVYTTDNKSLIGDRDLEEHEARYQYYKHGPLAKASIGHQQVQGMDYAYTLQGWLKGVNSTGASQQQDMGGDGSWIAKDAFGFSLNYFTGDYKPIGSGVNPFPGHSAFLPAGAYKPLYNGNISSMAVSIDKLEATQLHNYRYDQLNRLTGMDAYRGFDAQNNTWQGLSTTDDYKEQITYDGNGNILSYFRNGAKGEKGLPMDNLRYGYNRNDDGQLVNNRLRHVKDEVINSPYGEDLEGQQDDNYSYDEIGNLVRDEEEKIEKIEWNVYGKIKSILKKDSTLITYSYDASGNRISKQVSKAGSDAGRETVTTWYVRDAQGNTMAVYEEKGGKLALSEHLLYGSSRLGMWIRNINMDVIPTASNVPLLGPATAGAYQRGWKRYELSNHLGNVLAVVSDQKIAVPSPANSSLIDHFVANIVSAQDYYPFGMQMPGRIVAAGGYRYGFNGKENDNEVKGEGNQQDYGMRIYDPRLGRFLSVDPITKNYPSLTPYQFASNSPIKCIDLDGLEGDPVAEISLWLEDGWNDLTSAKRWKEAARNVNKGFNLLYIGVDHISKIATKKDLEGIPVDYRGRMGATADAGVDAMMIITGERFFKVIGAYGTNVLEAEMNSTRNALQSTKSPKPPVNKPTLQTTKEVTGRAASSEVLGKNLELSGTSRPANSAAHHMVAGADSRAATARAILKREGIDINESSNGVFLPKNSKYVNPPASTHSTLHTDKYYQEINRRLLGAKPGEVKQELNQIKNELLKGTFPH